MCESQSCTAFQADRGWWQFSIRGHPLLRRVCTPVTHSVAFQQFWTCTTWVILFRHRRTKGGSKSRPQLYVIGQAFEADGVTKRDAIEMNTYSRPAFPNWEHRSSLQSLVLRHRRSKGGDKTSTPSNQRPKSGRWYLLLLTLPCNTGWSN